MSNILRSTISNSFRQFRLSYSRLSDGALLSRTTPCSYQLSSSSSLHSNVPSFYQAKGSYQQRNRSQPKTIEGIIKKIDTEARRNGRIPLREVEEVFEGIKSTKSASETNCLMVIRCCGNLLSEEPPHKRSQLLQDVWKTFDKLGVKFDITHYNTLLRVYLENEYDFVPSEILAEMEERGLEPNRITYQRFIVRYCQIGDIEGATRILEHMGEKDMPVNEAVFNALVLGHSRAGDMANAEATLELMRQSGIEPTAATYTTLICGYIRQGDMDKVKSTLQECRDKNVNLIDKDYLEIVYHLALKDLDVDEILSQIECSSTYNQEAINYIYKLVNAGKYEVAYKIINTMLRSTRQDGSTPLSGGFFVAALVRSDAPFETVIKYCDRLVEDNLNPRALGIALENSLRHKKESLALDLMRAAKERDFPIRPHYFWPLLIARGKADDTKGVYKLLSTMTTEFSLTVNTETLRDYVLPYLLKKDTNIASLVSDLKTCGLSVANVASALVIRLLQSNDIHQAAEVASAYRCNYAIYFVRKPLVDSFLKTLDVESFTTILQKIAASIQWRGSGSQGADKGDDDAEIPEYREAIGFIVLQVTKQLKSEPDCNVTIENILKSLHEKGIGIGSKSAELIQNTLQGKLTQEISALLEKLTADDFSKAEQRRPTGGRTINSDDLDEVTLLRLYENMKAEGKPVKGIQKQLFNVYGRTRNLDKLLELKEEMERDNFVLTNGMYAHLIDAYLENEKFDEAMKLFKSRCEVEPDFVLNPTKMLKLAYAALQNEQYDSALEVLSKKSTVADKRSSENTPFVTGSLCWRILNHFAEKGDVEEVKRYFDLIIENGYCTVNNILLGPLIKVHLVKDDLDGALAAFEDCCKKYRATPFKTELTKKCIELEDAAHLQKINDLSTEIHGELNSLYDLMFAFLECNKLKQATKILTTPGLRVRQDRLQNACQKYQNSGSIEHLENLLEVTKNISIIDRSDLYYNLLLSYDKAKKPEKASELWLQMQELNENPTEPFLMLLADIFKRNNIPVTFAVPENLTKAPRHVQKSDDKIEMGSASREFRRILKSDDVDKALEFKNSKSPGELNNTDLSLLMEALLKNGRYRDAKEVFEEISARGVLPMTRIMKFFLINAMTQGDVDLLESLDSKLDDRMKAYTMLSNRLGNAYIISGRTDEFLEKLEKGIDSADSKPKVEQYLKAFPNSVLFSLLQASPEYLPKVQKIAEKCLERDPENVGPMNVLWSHYLMQNNDEEAEKIWTNYLQNSEKLVIFKGLCREAVKKGNLQVVQKVKDYLERRPVSTPKALGIAYGSMIKILVFQDKIPEALKVLEEADAKVKVENIMRNALDTLRAACVSQNIPFKYDLSKVRASTNDDDSDSD